MARSEKHFWGRLKDFSQCGKRNVISAEHLENNFVLDRGEAIEYLQEFSKRHWGTYVVGRRGYSTRIILFPLVTKALKDTTVLTSTSPGNGGSSPSADKGSPAYDTSPSESGNLIEHTYQLRPDYRVAFSLPADLNDKEATRMAKFIESLPM
jgi:hypothetical protein